MIFFLFVYLKILTACCIYLLKNNKKLDVINKILVLKIFPNVNPKHNKNKERKKEMNKEK